jgi:hypothetical protein
MRSAWANSPLAVRSPEYTEAIPDWQKPELEKIAEQARPDAANRMRRPFKAIMIPLDC